MVWIVSRKVQLVDFKTTPLSRNEQASETCLGVSLCQSGGSPVWVACLSLQPLSAKEQDEDFPDVKWSDPQMCELVCSRSPSMG